VSLEHFSRKKLLNGGARLVSEDHSGSLACLSVVFGLKFNEDPISQAVVCMQVEQHMQLCLDGMRITFSGSEPLLAEAASQLFRSSLKTPVWYLANHQDLSCIDRGRHGEIVAALIIMHARENALARNRRWVTVDKFMEALLPEPAYKTLQSSLPTFWRKGEDRTFSETFGDYAMWFNHIIWIEDNDMINSKFLWMFITRGAMIICSYSTDRVDIVLPLCLRKGNLSHDTVTAVLIQVKNADRFGSSIENICFDEMDPFEVGLFSDNQAPRPLIRMVLALGSDAASVLIAPPHEDDQDADSDDHHPFTSFDIWCAGLSPDTFKNISPDLDLYRQLLRWSKRTKYDDAIELRVTGDHHLDDVTRRQRELLRRRMTGLVMFDDDHRSSHVNNNSEG
jgi:hypothetical protein